MPSPHAFYNCSMIKHLAIITLLTLIVSCASYAPEGTDVASSSVSQPTSATKVMKTSFYASSFNGRKTASGEIYRENAHTAAHRTYPFGTMLRLTNPANGKYVTVRVNDRGPFVKGRDLDISGGAAKALGITGAGVADLQVQESSVR